MSILVNAYSTHLNPIDISFPHVLNNRRGLSDPELTNHLNGFHSYILERGGSEMTKIKYHLLRHIQRVNHQFSFDLEEAHLDDLSRWALESNSILFLPDGTVRDPNGHVLFYPDGRQADDAAFIPFLDASYSRKHQTEALLKARHLNVPPTPPIPCEHEISLRPVSEIVLRAMSLFVVAVRAESIATGDPLDIETLKERIPSGFVALSPAEEAFLKAEHLDDNPDESLVVQFVWRYEAAALLLWVLGILPELPFPDSICDVPEIARLMLDSRSWEDRVELRVVDEVLDCLDLHYRLHWLCRQAGIDGADISPDIDRGVVLERHYALNWLIGFENSDWDDVDTPT